MKIKLPTTLSDVTVSEYQAMLELVKSVKDEKLLAYRIISLLSGMSKDDVYKLPFSAVEDMMLSISSLIKEKPSEELIPRFELDGVEYGFIPDLDDISFGEYIDLDNYWKADDENLALANKFMAVAFRPIVKSSGNTYDIEPYEGSRKYADIMKDAPVSVYLSAAVFFCDLSSELLSSSLAYLKAQESQSAAQGKTSTEDGDGTEALEVLLAKILRNTNQLLAYRYPQPLRHYLLKRKNAKSKT